MRLRQLRGPLGATWILGAGLVGLLANVTSLRGAALVFGIGLMPPVLLMVPWHHLVRAMRAHPANPNHP